MEQAAYKTFIKNSMNLGCVMLLFIYCSDPVSPSGIIKVLSLSRLKYYVRFTSCYFIRLCWPYL